MELVLKSKLQADLNITQKDIDIKNGPGKFFIEGGHEKKYYHFLV